MNIFEERNLLPETLPDSPMHLAKEWFNKTSEDGWQPNPNAMTLSTVDKYNTPSSRIVLCKYFKPDPGYVVFFTNYNSRKGQEIKKNSEVSLVFHWDNIGRQVRIKGKAVFSPSSESDEYFASRNRGSQISAWGSNQSQSVKSRESLVNQMNKIFDEFNTNDGQKIKCHALHIGEVFASGHMRLNCGWMVRIVSMIELAGQEKFIKMKTIRSLHQIG